MKIFKKNNKIIKIKSQTIKIQDNLIFQKTKKQ